MDGLLNPVWRCFDLLIQWNVVTGNKLIRYSHFIQQSMSFITLILKLYCMYKVDNIMNYNFKIICPWLYAITLITVWVYMSLFFLNTNIIFCRQWRPLKMVPQQLYLISLKSHRPSNRYFFSSQNYHICF